MSSVNAEDGEFVVEGSFEDFSLECSDWVPDEEEVFDGFRSSPNKLKVNEEVAEDDLWAVDLEDPAVVEAADVG